MPSATDRRFAGLLDEAGALLDEIVRVRRLIHRHPEIGLQLPRTQETVLRALEGLGLDVKRGERLSSVIAVLDGARPGPTVLLRADMDALPIREDTGLEFASEVDGAMHACGHDTHVAMLVGAAHLLAARRRRLAGRVVFMFQPGEEGYAGARLMLEEGLLDHVTAPTAAFAIHMSPLDASGAIATRPGPLMAPTSRLQIVVRGRGGHAAEPHDCIDPVPIACEIVQALQTFVTRRLNISDPAVISVTRFQAGTAVNVIPDTATLQGTVRVFSEQTHTLVADGIRRLAQGIAAAHGAAADIDIRPVYPTLVNDASVVERVTATATRLFGADAVRMLPAAIMPSEDFAYVLQRVPGAMVFLGSRVTDDGRATSLHSPRMVLDERAMIAGAALHAAVALAYLAPEGGP